MHSQNVVNLMDRRKDSSTVRDRLAEVRSSEPWLTKSQLAQQLAVSTRTVDRKVKKGMPCRTVGTRRRFKEREVLLWLDGR